jgi:hypothetical protein
MVPRNCIWRKELQIALKVLLVNYKLNANSNNLFILIKELRVTDYLISEGVQSNNELQWNQVQ